MFVLYDNDEWSNTRGFYIYLFFSLMLGELGKKTNKIEIELNKLIWLGIFSFFF